MAPPDPGPRPDDLTPWAARSTGGQRFRRGLTLRCPRCGADGIGAGLLELAERCPACSWQFEREEGYWLGAMVVLFVVVETLFALLLLIGIATTWPDVPWTALLVAGLLLNGTLPFLLHAWSRATWLGLHTAVVPAELTQDDAARTGSS